MITALQRFISWVDSSGRPVDIVATTLEDMTREVNKSTVLEGSGSPEGAVIAEPKVLYMDTAGTAGNILYVKKTGTGNTGWILI